MFGLIKLIQSLIGALHSEGTPGQLAAGLLLGSFLGLTPLLNLHNALIFAALELPRIKEQLGDELTELVDEVAT